ncbi:sugar phosphate isomerase/epimerase family protein [Curtobacterium sp. MCBD17_035]|uniref:sugar phosphate isomerase/epimerase family protein n=1 Tax=Curtobacterium sp. MCBD17_035 TaxID=2175673 RepID=UPI000DA8AAA9|nr:sugar phosphate isomerase/epimerase family protein [Curtobacterium sp. MCBD17_035]WIB66796.1 sugar phosphate isomerase/epimerase family protein [Curtobacterium sp. MCBD17_035]
MTEAPAWTLSGFGDEIDDDPVVQVAVLQALGASAIEVRSAWGVNVVDLDEDQLAGLHRLLEDRGQSVSAVASPIGKVDVGLPVEHEVTRLERAIAAAHALGTRDIRVFSFYRSPEQTPEDVRDAVLTRMRALADVAEREGVRLLHENEKDIYGDVPERVLDVVESVGSDALRLAWDNANYVQCGVHPFTDGWGLLAPYVVYLQVKDALAADGTVVPAGEGDGELRETLAALRDAGYDGHASLEPHLASATRLGGSSGPAAFGRAARAFRDLTRQIGVTLR